MTSKKLPRRRPTGALFFVPRCTIFDLDTDEIINHDFSHHIIPTSDSEEGAGCVANHVVRKYRVLKLCGSASLQPVLVLSMPRLAHVGRFAGVEMCELQACGVLTLRSGDLEGRMPRKDCPEIKKVG